VTEEHR